MSANWNSSSGSASSTSGRSRLHNNSNADRLNNHVSCVICSERYKAVDNIYAGTCGHVFHWDCLLRWWEESKNCPICRSTNADYFQIYLDFEETPRSQNQIHSRSHGDVDSNQYENLLYEADLYKNEIEYLNTRIQHLKIKCEQFSCIFDDSD